MLQRHTFKITWVRTTYAPDTAATKHSKPRVQNPRVLQRTERLPQEGPAAVGVALKSMWLPGDLRASPELEVASE